MTDPPQPTGRATSLPVLSTGFVLALGAASCYGVQISLAALAYAGGANAGAVILLRMSVTAAAMALALLWMRRPFRVPPEARLRLFGAMLGVFGVTIGLLCSILYIPVSLMTVIFYTYPLLVAAIAPAVGGDLPTRAQMVAFPLAFLGLFFALGPEAGGLDWRGVAFALLAAASSTWLFLISPRLTATYDVFGVSFYVTLGCALLVLPALPLFGGLALPATAQGWGGLVGVAVLFVAATGLHFAALRRTSAVLAALAFNIEPVTTIAGAAILLGERLSLGQLGGVGLVLAALFLATRRPHRRSGCGRPSS